MPLSWDMSSYDGKLRNYQKCLAWPPLSGYVDKSWLLTQFNEKWKISSKKIESELTEAEL